MLTPNKQYQELKDTYLFNTIYRKTDEYRQSHPDKKIYLMGVGDVSRPLCEAVIRALHQAVEDQATMQNFQGYMPERGAAELREAISAYYRRYHVAISPNEIFISSGACDDLGDILELFAKDNTVLVLEPAYPEYVDTNILAGRKVVHLNSGEENGFLPAPPADITADIIYICSPNNPTGAAFDMEKLQAWVDYANAQGAVILFDAAYEVFISDPSVPHSIYEIEGADTCAIEICSLSKMAGFTGTRLGYTVVPEALIRMEMNLNTMWARNRETRTNGVSYILQKGAAAVFTPEGYAQTRQDIQVYQKNARMLMDAFDQAGIWYTGGKNSPYIWIKCPDGMGGWEFFDYLLQKIQVVGIPGEGFGACGKGYFRFSAFGDPADTEAAAGLLCILLGKAEMAEGASQK